MFCLYILQNLIVTVHFILHLAKRLVSFILMTQDVVLSFYFLLFATLVLLLGPSYLLAIIKLVQFIRESTNNNWMPQKLENSPLDCDKKPENECKHVPLKCPWIITSKDKTLTVIITCLKWTFKYNFWMRVTVHSVGNSEIWKQIDLDDHHPLLKSQFIEHYLRYQTGRTLISSTLTSLMEKWPFLWMCYLSPGMFTLNTRLMWARRAKSFISHWSLRQN